MFTNYREFLADVEVYNFGTNQWRVSNSLLSKRWGLNMFVLNNKLTVSGGRDVGSYIRSLEEYNGSTWTLLNKTLNNDQRFSASVVVPCN